MAKIQFDPELMQHIKAIYGDAELDGKILKQLHQTWKSNPNYIRNAAQQKKKVIQQKSTLGLKPPTPEKIISPIIETAQDDLTGISDFNTAFKIARQRGLKQFKWRSTKANPSGMFGTQLASSIQKPTQKPTSDKDSESSTKSNTVETVETAIKEPRRSFFKPTIKNYDEAISSNRIFVKFPQDQSFQNWSKQQAYQRGGIYRLV